MRRRAIFKSLLGIAAIVGLAPRITAYTDNSTDDSHQCVDMCFSVAEDVARANIRETGKWKLQLHDWTKRRMVVTRCGQAACEVTMTGPSHHPYWEYKRRYLTHEEKTSFHVEYGRSHDLILLFRRDDPFLFRGFILNGRQDGWNLSVNSHKDDA